MANKTIHILGGGTVSYVRNHLALAAPAYGGTARRIYDICGEYPTLDRRLHLTAMAGGVMETNADLESCLQTLTSDPSTKIIFMSCAIIDFAGQVESVDSGPYAQRLKSTDYKSRYGLMRIYPTNKLLPSIRKHRKDIFLVAFKTTTGASEDEQYIAGLHLLKKSSANLVLANDMVTLTNMIITPEEARYHTTTDRDDVIRNLVHMTMLRSHLTFTRSTVVDGTPIPWSSELVPDTLRSVVNYCISQQAYKAFNGATVGHFACKLNENTFLTSIRKTNFNDLHQIGMVMIKTDGPDSVIAYGAKPSVGGQSQRIVFHDHQEYDCIVHFHCPKKDGSKVPTVSQREYECGSHECGRNTSNGLKKFGNLSAVYLAEHGPNIVFHHDIDPLELINFINSNFDLSQKTGGYVKLGSIL